MILSLRVGEKYLNKSGLSLRCKTYIRCRQNYATFCMLGPSNEYAELVIPSLSVLVHLGGRLKFVDICVIGIVSLVCLNRFPFPLRSLKFDLISNSRLTMLSAVCQLVGILDACEFFAGRLFAVKAHHPGWNAVEIIVWLSSGLLFGPACRSFFSGLFFNKRVRTEPVKSYTSRY